MRQRLLQLWLASPSTPYAWLLEATPRSRCLYVAAQPCSTIGAPTVGVSSAGALLPLAGVTWWATGFVGRGLAVLCLAALGLTAVTRVGCGVLLGPGVHVGYPGPQPALIRAAQPWAQVAALPGASVLGRPEMVW
jgi:hypothetical protein